MKRLSTLRHSTRSILLASLMCGWWALFTRKLEQLVQQVGLHQDKLAAEVLAAAEHKLVVACREVRRGNLHRARGVRQWANRAAPGRACRLKRAPQANPPAPRVPVQRGNRQEWGQVHLGYRAPPDRKFARLWWILN
jgi:hypothetical protein